MNAVCTFGSLHQVLAYTVVKAIVQDIVVKLEGPLTQDVVVIRINKNVSDTHTLKHG